MQRTTQLNARGFTLIELLVVIAIIGIMAALLFPAVKSAMVKSQAVAVGNDGRQIWTALFAQSTEHQASGRPDVWPAAAEFADSTAFFRHCMEARWFGDKLTFGAMSAPGLTRVVTVDPTLFNAANNAWCVAVDVGQATYDETPFLFTRNFSGGGTLADINSLDPDEKPFGAAFGVIITAGGAMKLVRGGDSPEEIQKEFNPMNADNPFVRP